MTNPFSTLEIQLIKASLSTKTDEQIAELLERSVQEVREMIDELTGGQAEARAADIRKAEEEKRAEVNKKKFKETVQEEQKIKRELRKKELETRQQLDHNRKIERGRLEQNKVYKTRKVDTSEMIQVRIDHKTIIYVKPGTDIEKVKKQYTRRPIGSG